MSEQLWGCYAVDDHRQDLAFVADVLLFERLVIPVPPTDDPDAESMWELWDPARQDELLKILGGIAIRVPWTSRLRQKYVAARAKKEGWSAPVEQSPDNWSTVAAAQDVTGAVSPGAAHATRMLLTEEMTEKSLAPSEARALAVYASPLRFDEEWRLQRRLPFVVRQRHAPIGQPLRYEVYKAADDEQWRIARLLVGEFALPGETDTPEEEVLRAAVSLAGSAEMREWRRQFHQWVADMAGRELSDETLVREMDEHLVEYDKRVRSGKRASRTKTCGTVVGAGVGVSAAVWGPAAPPIARAVAKAPISAVTTVVADRAWQTRQPGDEQAAALLAEARRVLSA